MRAENFTPGSIPNYQDLETLAEQSFVETRTDLLMDIRGGGLQREMERDKELSYALQSYAGHIAHNYLYATNQFSPDLEDPLANSVYQALHVGASLSQGLVRPEPWGFDYGAITRFEGSDEFCDYMLAAANRYMIKRPALDVILAAGVEMLLDRTTLPEQLHAALPVAEAAAQLLLLQTEEYRLDLHFMALASSDDFTFFDSQFEA